MHLLDNASVVNILRNTLGYVDTRLMDHGTRVSYMAYKMLHELGGFTELELRDMSVLALLHDIGAYKTEEIDRMIEFETEEVWDHSIWGYLFLSYFSPLTDIAPAVLYHHAGIKLLGELSLLHRMLAQVIHICDRADTYMLQGNRDYKALHAAFDDQRGTQFDDDIVALFKRVNTKPASLEEIEADASFHHLMHEIPFTPEAIEAYLRMDVLSIDFRSHNTATHTITTSACSRALATYLNLDPEAVEAIATGAMLHDLGKTGIPVEILEYPGKLSPQAMEIMKQHVVLTEKILTGNVDPRILHIAVRHHEKLNGTGYPYGLDDAQLNVAQRIVAVADIVSALYEARSYKQHYPKERILGIITRSADEGLIDKEVVSVVCKHFDDIARDIDAARDPVQAHYEELQQSFAVLKARLDPDHPREASAKHPHDDGYAHLQGTKKMHPFN